MSSEADRLPYTWSLAIHELRAPLAVASGYVRMLLREEAGAVSSLQRKMLEETGHACARLGTLVAEMSELEKLDSGELSMSGGPFDLAALVVELGSRISEGKDRGIRLEVRTASPVMVAGDRPRLAAALNALVHAVLRERGEPGVIVVECSARPDISQVWAVVTIGDEVITRALVDEANTRATQFDESRGGFGLALPLGRRVIEAHGGAVWAVPGGATRLGAAIRLPGTM